MVFDVIDLKNNGYSEEGLSTVQMQLLRTAQKSKNKLYHDLQKDIETYRTLLATNGMTRSSLYTSGVESLQEEYEYQVAILSEQLLYALQVNEPYPDSGEYDETTGYIVDYSLSYTDRYIIVRDYYLAIEDPAERMSLYANDEVAKNYLGNYYTTLYNVLYTYSK